MQENIDDVLLVEDDELIGVFLDLVENHKMVVENSGLLTVAALKAARLKKEKSSFHLKRRKYGRNYYVFCCTAWTDPEK